MNIKSIQEWHTSEFFEIHKIGNIGIFVLPKIENKGGIVISDIIFNLVTRDSSKFVFAFIWLAIVYKLFTLELVQKCQ